MQTRKLFNVNEKLKQSKQFARGKNKDDFLLVINTNLPPILHCFGDTAFQMSKSLFLATPLALKPPDGGVSLGRSP